MIDLTKLKWGLQPFKTGNYLAVFGARTIWDGNKITFLPDRQQFTGNSEASGVLWDRQQGLAETETVHHRSSLDRSDQRNLYR